MGCAAIVCMPNFGTRGRLKLSAQGSFTRRPFVFRCRSSGKQILAVKNFLQASGPENVPVPRDHEISGDRNTVLNNTGIAGVWPADLLTHNEKVLASKDIHETFSDAIVVNLKVQSAFNEELSETPAHPEGLSALYGTYLASCFMERVWRFLSSMTVSLLHQSLLPVAVVGFVGQLVIFTLGPWVGTWMDSMDRVHSFITLSAVQTFSMLISAGVILYALRKGVGPVTSSTSLLMQPWFLILVTAGAVERLTGLASGVAVERDWVVLLAGSGRAIALADANSSLRRIEMMCEIAGPCVFGLLLSRCGPAVSIIVASAAMMSSLPILIILVKCTDKWSRGVLHRPKRVSLEEQTGSLQAWARLQVAATKGEVLAVFKGWTEYFRQPVLPASLAYVLLYFNAVLSPGSLMTSFLTQYGVNPSMIGFFRGMCALMGFGATFISTTIIGKLGVLKAGAAALTYQAFLLAVAVLVYWTKPASHQGSLTVFLLLIVLSRLGHWGYDMVDTQILQTAVLEGQTNSIGTAEMSLASLAELLMLGVAIVANDVGYFGGLSALSMLAVAGSAGIYWHWISNPTAEQIRLFPNDFFLEGSH